MCSCFFVFEYVQRTKPFPILSTFQANIRMENESNKICTQDDVTQKYYFGNIDMVFKKFVTYWYAVYVQ